MSSKDYRGCTITLQRLGFLTQFLSGDKVLSKDAFALADCQTWIDRQLAHLAIEKLLGDK